MGVITSIVMRGRISLFIIETVAVPVPTMIV